MHIRSPIILAFSVICTACAVVPQAQYKQITKPEDMAEMSDSFYLQASSISVTANGETQKAVGPQANISADNVSIVSKPIEYKGFRMGIHPVDTWRSTTIINITKMNNLDLFSSADIQITDNTVKVITEVGGALVAIGKLAGGLVKEASLCTTPISYDLDYSGAPNPMSEVLSDPNNCIKVTLGPVPPDAIPTSKLPTDTTRNFYYSACRDATVEVNFAKKIGTAKAIVKVSDHDICSSSACR
ncbi:hypothetical protein [Paraburkholderia kururiensis]|uniref:hypothetical protein n=1 Tax=Paraburkholderia kururiensis TaxID=984307 RepID=UPI0005A67CCD|nr:hypothetical protein [Paraburkholderia kururiensis]